MSDPTPLPRATKKHSPSNRAADPLVGTTLGGYVIEARIGEGGLGRVYRGVQTDIGLRVAIKVLGTGDGPPPEGFVERFQREAIALARVSHPNIVRILGYSAGPPFPYLVMELVEDARPLGAYLSEPQPPLRALHLLRQILYALEAVHGGQVVHRDLKPGNILVQSVPGEPHLVRLLDFGLAKFLETGQATRIAGGTPNYMAPEQAGRGSVGPSADLYAVGVLALEMLAGRRTFSGLAEMDVLRLKRDPAFQLRSLMPEATLAPSLAAFVDRATSFRPEDRFPDAPSFRRALEAALLGAEVAPESPREQRTLTLDEDALEAVSQGTVGSRPVLGAVERPPGAAGDGPVSAPSAESPVAGRGVFYLWGAVAALGLVLAVVLFQEEAPPPQSVVSKLSPLTREPSPPETVVEAVAVPAETPRPAPPRSSPNAAPTAPSPRAIPAVPAAASIAAPAKIDLEKLRSALQRCDCAGARAQIAGLSRVAPSVMAAVETCRPPMLGEPCAPGQLP